MGWYYLRGECPARVAGSKSVSTTDANSGIPDRTSPPPTGRGRRPGEAEVVLTKELGPVLRAWVVRWLRAYPPRANHQEGNGTEFMGPLQWLQQESGVRVRQISRIKNEEQLYASLSHAEALLMAIDREYMLHNGEIHIIPNPSWSQEQYVEYMQERGGCDAA